MDNDALDSVDQFKGAIIAVLDRLRRLAPAAIQDGIGRGDPRRRRRFGIPHDAHQDIERGSGVAARLRTDFSERFSHGLILLIPAAHIRKAPST